MRSVGEGRLREEKAGDRKPLTARSEFVLLVFAYLCADLILNKFAIGAGWAILWPLNGITVALMLRRPRRSWLLLLGAVELGTLLGEGIDTQDWSLKLLERAWSSGEVLLTASLLPAFESFEDWLAQPRIVRRIAAAVVLGPSLSGIAYAVQERILFQNPLTTAWSQWATPDILGIAVTLPLTLALIAPETRVLFSRRRLRQTAIVLCVSVMVAVLVFSEESYPVLFLLYPMLLIVDSRLSFAGSSIAVFLASVIGVCCTVHGYGPFGHWRPDLRLSSDTALQIYLGFHVVALLPLSLVLLERRKITAELQRANKQLSELARLDPLTGVMNRRGFDEAYNVAWSSSLDQLLPVSLLLVDVDHFKLYNDQYGHVAGDECLVRVASALNRLAGVGQNRVARFGGEEFIVLLPGCTAAASYETAEMLRRAVIGEEIPHDRNDTWGIITISIGCASAIPSLKERPVDLLACADEALYKAKQGGRNRWETMAFRNRESRQFRQMSRLDSNLAATVREAMLF